MPRVPTADSEALAATASADTSCKTPSDPTKLHIVIHRPRLQKNCASKGRHRCVAARSLDAGKCMRSCTSPEDAQDHRRGYDACYRLVPGLCPHQMRCEAPRSWSASRSHHAARLHKLAVTPLSVEARWTHRSTPEHHALGKFRLTPVNTKRRAPCEAGPGYAFWRRCRQCATVPTFDAYWWHQS
jgi:hypothetical protein